MAKAETLDLIPDLSLTANLALFAALVATIWFDGTLLSHLANQSGRGISFISTTLLATTT